MTCENLTADADALRDVRFRYPGSQQLILNGLNIVLEPGKNYTLVGANGCESVE